MRNTLTVVKPKEQAETTELINPLADLWEIELLFGRHPDYSTATYAVRFTTRLEGNASKSYLVIDLEDHFNTYVRELNVFGFMLQSDFHRAIHYIQQLKVKGIFTRVDNLLEAMNGTTDQDEGNAFYDILADAVCGDIDRFPSINSDAYKHGESPGVRIDTEFYVSKYGTPVVAVTSEYLYELFELSGNNKVNRLLEIGRAWRDSGLILVKNKQGRLQEDVKPNLNSKVVKRFYILSLEALFANQGLSMPEFTDADAPENT
ncbi:hypothetical protein ACF3MZ_14320 [Paenibacillaceae bacterium WGS1546]|uniref:hypothetical protein n=1 Tax=Cohnella sp. WGS1546 TaxID=3366810 RepID=UPI00372D79BD